MRYVTEYGTRNRYGCRSYSILEFTIYAYVNLQYTSHGYRNVCCAVLPYTVQYVKSSLGQIDDSLMQAGSVFSGNYIYIFRKIILPLIIPGILAGWAMTFTISIRELVASLLVLPPSVETSATFIFAQFEQGEVSIGMAMAVVSVGLTTICLLLLQHMEQNEKVA